MACTTGSKGELKVSGLLSYDKCNIISKPQKFPTAMHPGKHQTPMSLSRCLHAAPEY